MAHDCGQETLAAVPAEGAGSSPAGLASPRSNQSGGPRLRKTDPWAGILLDIDDHLAQIVKAVERIADVLETPLYIKDSRQEVRPPPPEVTPDHPVVPIPTDEHLAEHEQLEDEYARRHGHPAPLDLDLFGWFAEIQGVPPGESRPEVLIRVPDREPPKESDQGPVYVARGLHERPFSIKVQDREP